MADAVYENVKKQHIVDANKNSYSFPNANKIVYREELKELIKKVKRNRTVN